MAALHLLQAMSAARHRMLQTACSRQLEVSSAPVWKLSSFRLSVAIRVSVVGLHRQDCDKQGVKCCLEELQPQQTRQRRMRTPARNWSNAWQHS